MQIDSNTHRLIGARFVASPNCDARPCADDMSLIVIHSISLPPRQFGSDHVERLFTNRLNASASGWEGEVARMRVSAHLFVRRNGDLIQFVAFNQRAWHAGESCYAGRYNCNDYSIGVELEGDDETPFEDAQYRTLGAVVRALIRRYPTLSEERITTHAAIAPERKTDPGPHFDHDFLARYA